MEKRGGNYNDVYTAIDLVRADLTSWLLQLKKIQFSDVQVVSLAGGKLMFPSSR